VYVLLALACRPGDKVPESPTPPELPTSPPGSTTPEASTDSWSDGTWTSRVEVEDVDTLARTYHFSTDQPLRDNAPQQVTVTEILGQPVLRSGRLMLDGLFALAVQEARTSSVSEISDGSFAAGAPLPCECFRTGELWPWVWTRDTAFAADLGLAWLDPGRVAESLRFKLSAGKPSGGLLGSYVLQDTGTGGSWPVSTDRVVWALGALAALETLPAGEREEFLLEARDAMVGTAEQDRIYTFDPLDGLYRGETSFLDWREQSYPPWMGDDAARIAETKALSTNVLHLVLLEGLVQLAGELGDSTSEARYGEWAAVLRQRIPERFRTEEGWASFAGGPLDPSPQGRDLLGTALAALVLEDPEEALASVATWPMGSHGPSVIWPNRPEPGVYHNRAIWPFASAYLLRAAKHAGHDGVMRQVAESLLRASALNLSHMENLDWSTGLPQGPAVNSRAQLWSIGAALSLVTDGIFGLQLQQGEITLSPLLPALFRDEWLGDEVVLHHFPSADGPVELRLQLPPEGATRPLVAVDEQREPGLVTVTLAESAAPLRPQMPLVSDALSPATPQILGVSAGVVTFSGDPGVTFEVWRDGELVASGLGGSSFEDPVPAGESAPCYAVAATDPATALRSHHSAPICDWGARVQVLDAHWLTGGGVFATDHGRPHIASFGAPGDSLQALFRPWYSGSHLLQPSFANGSGPVSTGVTAGHLWMTVREVGGAVVASGPVALPHTGAWDTWRDGTSLGAELSRDTTYELSLEVAPNGSWLEGYALYGGAGGGSEPTGWVDLAEIKLLARAGPGAPAQGDHVTLDGSDDLGAFPVEQREVPGVPLADWDGFALAHDEDYLYLAIVSPAFEDDLTPFLVYLQADPDAAIVPSSGMTYAGLVPELPFTPTHTIALRAVSDAGDGVGPYNGVWVPGSAGWRQVGRLQQGVSFHVASDRHTLSARVPWAWLGDPQQVRLVAHVVYAQPGEEWKDTVPAGHTPWDGGGSYSEITR
jgi:glycogen debranching enzyme